jgi:hypothetical protein
VTANTWVEVKKGLEDAAAKFSTWAKGNGLAMNAGKTQLLVSANAGPAADLSVQVGGNTISCGDTIELLGVNFDRKMTTAPHVDDLVKATRQRAALIARLGHHLPRGQYLRQLADGMVFGKVRHALGAVATPRLLADTPVGARYKAIQVAINDVARTVTGGKRSDHTSVRDLNDRAGFPTLNELVTQTVAMETWAAFNSTDGDSSGARNPLGAAMFNDVVYGRATRAAAAGQVKDPLGGANTLVSNGIRVWNLCQELRQAATKGAARTAAAKFARGVPL